MAISLPLGASNSGPNDWSDVYNNDAQLVTEIDARDDNYGTLFVVSGAFAPDAAAGTYAVDHDGTWRTAADVSTALGQANPPFIYLDDADYTVASKTTRLRLRVQIAANATSPGTITYTAGLYPVTVAGAADTLTYTLGAVISGSTAAAVNPSASTITNATGSDFAVPSDGLYAVGIVTTATLANNSAVAATAQLQVRHT